MKGQTVRIIVHEPKDWDKNLFGTILSDRGGDRLLIKLTQPIRGKKLTTDVMELRPVDENETFKSLPQYYSVVVKGSLVDGDNAEVLIIGSVTFD